MNREAGALRKAKDAILVDTNGLSKEQALELLVTIAREWTGKPG